MFNHCLLLSTLNLYLCVSLSVKCIVCILAGSRPETRSWWKLKAWRCLSLLVYHLSVHIGVFVCECLEEEEVEECPGVLRGISDPPACQRKRLRLLMGYFRTDSDSSERHVTKTGLQEPVLIKHILHRTLTSYVTFVCLHSSALMYFGQLPCCWCSGLSGQSSLFIYKTTNINEIIKIKNNQQNKYINKINSQIRGLIIVLASVMYSWFWTCKLLNGLAKPLVCQCVSVLTTESGISLMTYNPPLTVDTLRLTFWLSTFTVTAIGKIFSKQNLWFSKVQRDNRRGSFTFSCPRKSGLLYSQVT